MKWLTCIILFTLFSCKINQTKNGVPVGIWKYVAREEDNLNIIKARYDKGSNEKGVWKYFCNDTIYRLEKYYYPYCVNVLYHKNGRINKMGLSYGNRSSWSKIGTWYTYDEKAKLIDSITYENEKTPQ